MDEGRPQLEARPIGVPGASPASTPVKPKLGGGVPSTPTASPLQGKLAATPATPAPPNAPPPTPANRRDDEHDVSDDLVGFGLQGVKVSEDDLLALVEELGLGGDEADELVKGLGGGAKKLEKQESAKDA